MKRLLISILVVAAVATASSVAWATIPDASGVFHACVKKGGQVHLIDPSAGDACGKNETGASWSQTGPAGPSGAPGPQGPPGPAGPGKKTISGLVWIDGTVSLGTGYASTKTAPGDYEITFPSGTWPSFPVVVVSPFGLPGAFPIAEVGSAWSPGDGSATVHVLTSSTAGEWTPHDVAFWFIATAS